MRVGSGPAFRYPFGSSTGISEKHQLICATLGAEQRR
jgi:hypothetical protein